MLVKPRDIKDCTSFRPMNPVAPVTKIASFGLVIRGDIPTKLFQHVSILHQVQPTERQKLASMVAGLNQIFHEQVVTY